MVDGVTAHIESPVAFRGTGRLCANPTRDLDRHRVSDLRILVPACPSRQIVLLLSDALNIVIWYTKGTSVGGQLPN
jgi:hypothetical protein